MSRVPLPIMSFSIMTIPQLLEAHNHLAKNRNKAALKSWHESRCKLAERVALLRTEKEIPPPEEPKKARAAAAAAKKRRLKKRLAPVRKAVLKLLAIVDHYEVIATGQKITPRAAKRYKRKDVLSVGLPYAEIVKRLRETCPYTKGGSGEFIRWNANQVRVKAAGFENCVLPDKRPRNNRRPAKQ